MGRKRNNSAKLAAAALESKVSPILELKYEDPIFTMASHPTKNLIATGLATGHVIVHSYDQDELENVASKRKEDLARLTAKQLKSGNELPTKRSYWSKYNAKNIDDESLVKVEWKTRRHKGSCRSLAFDKTGETIFTVGTDKIIKMAQTETGKVLAKTPAIDIKQDFTKLVVAPNKPFIVVGSEAGHVHIFDTRTMKEVHKVLNAHDDAVSSITNMSALSDYQYLSVGSTTLTHFDIRKGIIQQSEDQEDEMLSVCFVDPSNCATAVAGMGEGVVTMWKKDKNDFVDQISRVRVGKDSVDSVISSLEEDGDNIWTGSADGIVCKVDTRRGKVIETRVHHSEDEVAGLDIDFDYRLISVGMDRLKIWSNKAVDSDDEDLVDTSDNEDDNSDTGSASSGEEDSDFDKNSSDDEDEDSSDSEDDEDLPRLKERGPPLVSAISKSKISPEAKESPQLGKNKSKRAVDPVAKEDEEEEKPSKKSKKAKITGKQLKNLQSHEHGIKRFEGL